MGLRLLQVRGKLKSRNGNLRDIPQLFHCNFGNCCHPWQKKIVRAIRGEHYYVGDYVLHHLRCLTYLLYFGRKYFPWKRIDRKRCVLPRLNLSDIALIYAREHLHAMEVFSDVEEGLRL